MVDLVNIYLAKLSVDYLRFRFDAHRFTHEVNICEQHKRINFNTIACDLSNLLTTLFQQKIFVRAINDVVSNKFCYKRSFIFYVENKFPSSKFRRNGTISYVIHSANKIKSLFDDSLMTVPLIDIKFTGEFLEHRQQHLIALKEFIESIDAKITEIDIAVDVNTSLKPEDFNHRSLYTKYNKTLKVELIHYDNTDSNTLYVGFKPNDKRTFKRAMRIYRKSDLLRFELLLNDSRNFINSNVLQDQHEFCLQSFPNLFT